MATIGNRIARNQRNTQGKCQVRAASSRARQDLLGLAVRNLEVECELCDEHVSLQPDLVHTGRGEGYGQTYEAHDGSGAFLGVSVGVLGPELAQQENHSVPRRLEGQTQMTARPSHFTNLEVTPALGEG